MRVIIDNNILFSLMKPDSVNSRIFSMMKVDFLAPDFIKKEFTKYEKECFKKSKLSKMQFKKRKREIFDKLRFINFSVYKDLIKKAQNLINDVDDSPYIALALKTNCPIWSNDKGLKHQSKVKILSTEDLIEILF